MPDELPPLVNDVRRWYAATTLAIGLRTGLTAALLDGGGTAEQLAARAGVDDRNASVWADAMVAAGYAMNPDERYVPDEDAIGLLRGGFPFDLASVVEILAPLGGMIPRVEQAIRDGSGIGSHEIQERLGALPEQVNNPMYEGSLLADWIPAFPDVEASLRSGADVAEIGPGGGYALRLLAAAFPRSRFTGFDLDPAQVERATASAARAGLGNLRFEARDAAALPPGSFDLVLAFDTFHHFGRPEAIAQAIHAALREGGSFLVAEASLQGDPTADMADPFAVIVYASNLLYCYQESRAGGGIGLGATWPPRHLDDLLEGCGFTIAGRHRSDAGYDLTRALPAVQG